MNVCSQIQTHTYTHAYTLIHKYAKTTNPGKCPLGVTSIKVYNNGSQSKARISSITNAIKQYTYIHMYIRSNTHTNYNL